METSLKKIQNDFKEIVKMIDSKLGVKYSVRNPGLIQHLLDKIQQQEDRALTQNIHKV